MTSGKTHTGGGIPVPPTITGSGTMIDWRGLSASAEAARERAYAPYSNYRVGAAVLADDGRIFLGANVENAAYPLTVCAERNAIANAIVGGARRFRAIAIASQGPTPASPCGGCRQVLSEFPPSFAVLCFVAGSAEGAIQTTVADLLPGAFGPGHLGAATNERSR